MLFSSDDIAGFEVKNMIRYTIKLLEESFTEQKQAGIILTLILIYVYQVYLYNSSELKSFITLSGIIIKGSE